MDQRTIPENILKHNSVQGRTEVMASELGRLAVRAQDAEERARLAESQAAELREEVERLQGDLGNTEGLLSNANAERRTLREQAQQYHALFEEAKKVVGRQVIEIATLREQVEQLNTPLRQMEAYAFCGDPEDKPMTETEKVMKGVAIIIDPLIEKITKERDELKTALERQQRAVTDEEWDNRPSVEAGPSYWPRLITAILATRSREQEPGK